jgi:hypothetical protein
MDKMNARLSEQQLAHLGGGVVGYVRQIEPAEARRLLGEQAHNLPNAKLFALYNADGTAISVSGSREAALGDAVSHDLVPASVH